MAALHVATFADYATAYVQPSEVEPRAALDSRRISVPHPVRQWCAGGDFALHAAMRQRPKALPTPVVRYLL